MHVRTSIPVLAIVLTLLGIPSVSALSTPGLCSVPSTSGGFTLQNCVPDGVAGKDTVRRLDVAGIRSLVNEYIVVFLIFLGSMAVAVIIFNATNIALYASNDSKRKEAMKAIQWVLFGLLGATLAYMIITSIIRGFYGLANG